MTLRPGATTAIRERLRGEGGATMVELSLIMVVLLTVIFGIVECGRLMLTYTTVAEAARAGTRYAIVHGSYRTGTGMDGPSGPGNAGNVVTIVENIATAAGLSSTNLHVNEDTDPYVDGSNEVGKHVRVTVEYDFSSVVAPLVPITVTLGSTSEGTICY